ncbi:hypothetical protein [Qipengyuania nanhaisediminis]|uniref:Uncharacterized protein n=1 Tax=Qipengyuania nanhaisediminis TaxID=604088 RepID=A0A1I5NY06_9SPHN|nr:hypothetical protein [Qipengyuania nanhaisediminis]SFP26111.1 hypothetical protein SAMN04488060_2143 [Qipengyuania nanhaisediminis]
MNRRTRSLSVSPFEVLVGQAKGFQSVINSQRKLVRNMVRQGLVTNSAEDVLVNFEQRLTLTRMRQEMAKMEQASVLTAHSQSDGIVV